MKLLDYLLHLSKNQPASLKYGKIVEIWFAIGSHGLKWKDTRVVDCKMQARLHGVHKGWMILAVDGVEVRFAEDVEALLSDASTAGMPYPIVFVTDPALVRAAEAKRKSELKEKVMKEIERRGKVEDVAQPQPVNVTAARAWARKEDRLRRIFDMCNTDGDDAVSKQELISICKINKGIASFFGIPRDLPGAELDQALESFFQDADADGDGNMTWEEFRTFYKRQTDGDGSRKFTRKWRTASLAFATLREKRLKEIFDKCDGGRQGSDGEISKNKLITAIKRDESIAEFFHLPHKFKKAEELEALREFQIRVDSNGDGMMSWEEFVEFDKKCEEQRHHVERIAQRRLTRFSRPGSPRAKSERKETQDTGQWDENAISRDSDESSPRDSVSAVTKVNSKVRFDDEADPLDDMLQRSTVVDQAIEEASQEGSDEISMDLVENEMTAKKTEMNEENQ